MRWMYICAVSVVWAVQAAAVAPLGERPGFTRLAYEGGGDWYNDPGILDNLHRYAEQTTGVPFKPDEEIIRLTDPDLSEHPMLYLTGHGGIRFSDDEIGRLRLYLMAGGFLYADDDYGMDEFFRREIARVFPEKPLIELPRSHPVYRGYFDFSKTGAPKIHQHHGGKPRVFGIENEGRLLVLYTFDTNISDGWADEEVHGDAPAAREQALRFGVNILMAALTVTNESR